MVRSTRIMSSIINIVVRQRPQTCGGKCPQPSSTQSKKLGIKDIVANLSTAIPLLVSALGGNHGTTPPVVQNQEKPKVVHAQIVAGISFDIFDATKACHWSGKESE